MANENRKNNTDWLIEKLRTAESERDEAIRHAKNLEIDNLRLRLKLQAISDIVSDEVYVEDMFIPDDDADFDISDVDENCVMPSI